MTLTIDQLRAWLERREDEASAAVGRLRTPAFELDRSTKEGRRAWDVFTICNARRNLYRELLEALETGRLPGDDNG